MLQDSNRKELLELARSAIKAKLSDNRIDIGKYSEYSEKKGVFVTLTIEGELRGCIGFVEAMYPLNKAIANAAQSAAFSDPRFPALNEEEFDKIKIEISILTKPALIKGNYTENIKIGEDGLIISSTHGAGLLLPQVAVEYGWDVQEFLQHTCMKAGLNIDAWKGEEVKLYKFQADKFSE
jgi:AmmeMemoRadiSam system protein A